MAPASRERRSSAPYRLPGIARRLTSMVYESLLLIGVLAGTVVLPHTIHGMLTGRNVAPWLLWLHVLTVISMYFIWFWTHGGQTLAMKTWRIRLIDASSGNAVSTPRAMMRFALCGPSLGFFAIGILWALFDRERQFLHDRIAGTCLTVVSAAPPTRSS